MAQEHFINVDRTARVYTHGILSGKTQKIWVVAHGYAMLAAYFIKKFEVLDPEKHFVIAPEGLSRAYIEGMSGRVGASWMTREMRQQEIEDYVSYLDRVVAQFTTPEILSKADLVALGFSQGAATISRWVHYSDLKFHAMIIWGGAPAKELFSVNCFSDLPIFFAFGDKDVYINFANKERLKEQSEEKGWHVEFIDFKGGHHLSSPLISTISKKL
jgi:predicted esterase